MKWKYLLLLILSAAAAAFLLGCSEKKTAEAPASSPAQTTNAGSDTNVNSATAGDAAGNPANPDAPKKILVAYYSWGGNTKVIAEYIHKAVGGSIFEITPKEPYSTSYPVVVAKAKMEIANGEGRELAASVPNIADYDIIFLGTPNWWGTMAPPVRAFLSSHDLNGKKIYPFVTHGSGGLQNVHSDMKKFAPSLDISDSPLALYGDNVQKSETDVHAWLRKIGMK